MGGVSGDDLVREAGGELYSGDPEEFIERRGVLAARARAAGDAVAAKRIAGLRKPTRSAWVLNQLVRSKPGVPGQLAELGEELRAAQQSLDGAAIRELSVRRRRLLGTLARQAFSACGMQSPPAALRDEVTATLGAAMIDPEIAEQLRAGMLDRAARRDGFGPPRPALAVVPSPSAGPAPTAARRPPAAKARPRPAAVQQPPAAPAGPRRAAARSPAAAPAAATPAVAKPADLAAARARAEKQRRQAAIAEAKHAAAEADRAADAATESESAAVRAVALLEQQLADARRDLADARRRARQAEAGRRRARHALGRLQE